MELRQSNRRVLIVEPEAEASNRVALRALELGLEPVVCPGVTQTRNCPALSEDDCPKSRSCGAVLVSVDGDTQARVASTCAGDAPLAIARLPFGPPARVVVADRHVERPYDPAHMALVLLALADSPRTPRRRLGPGDRPTHHV